MTNLDHTFTALADPTRRGVIDLLRKAPMRAGDLADALSASPPAMSRHLRVLRTAGLVQSGNDGDARERIYRLCQEPFAQLHDWLEHVEAFWTVQLAAFKKHVESRKR